MRWLKWALVACWLGVHASLWMTLPPVPRLRISDAYFMAFAPGEDGIFVEIGNRFQLRAIADGRTLRDWAWPDGASSGSTPQCGGWKTLMYDKIRSAPLLFDLDTGRHDALPPFNFKIEPGPFRNEMGYGWFVQLSADGRTTVQTVRRPDGVYGLIVRDADSGEERFIPFSGEPLSTWISPDAHSAVVVCDPGENFEKRPLEFIDLKTGRVRNGQMPAAASQGYLSNCTCDFSPDRQTVAVNVTNYLGTRMIGNSGGSISECGYAVAWFDVSTARCLGTREGCFFKGWTSDGDCLVGCQRLRGRSGPEPFSQLVAEYDQAPALPVVGGRFAVFGQQQNYLSNLSTDAVMSLAKRFGLPTWLSTLHWQVVDIETGKCIEATCAGTEVVALAPSGRRLVTCGFDFDKDLNSTAEYQVWDLPPHKPGGLILGLMIFEVGVATLWTAWQRWRLRRKPCAAPGK